MHDIANVLKTIERVYTSNTNFQILKDFERVLDELDLYVFSNWEEGELAEGPVVERHWVTCTFMWPYKNMPDPIGGKRLIEYNCKVKFIKSEIIEPRRIRTPDDIRPGTKKGKLDSKPVWFVEICMPKKLISDIWVGYQEKYYSDKDILDNDVVDTTSNEEPDDSNESDDFDEFEDPMQGGGQEGEAPENQGMQPNTAGGI